VLSIRAQREAVIGTSNTKTPAVQQLIDKKNILTANPSQN